MPFFIWPVPGFDVLRTGPVLPYGLHGCIYKYRYSDHISFKFHCIISQEPSKQSYLSYTIRFPVNTKSEHFKESIIGTWHLKWIRPVQLFLTQKQQCFPERSTDRVPILFVC